MSNLIVILFNLLDHELCHSNSKLISDEEDTLKSFMAFDITPRESIFEVVVESQIVVPLTKSDAKICIDAINGPSIASPWRIPVLCSDTTKGSSLPVYSVQMGRQIKLLMF